MLGSLIAAIGLAALALSRLQRTRDRVLVHFAGFTILYGVRLAAESSLLRSLLPAPGAFWEYLDAVITYAILVPGTLFVAALAGAGWRRTLQRLPPLAAAAAIVAVAGDALRGPGAMEPLNRAMVLVCMAVGAVNGRPHRCGLFFWFAVLAPHVR